MKHSCHVIHRIFQGGYLLQSQPQRELHFALYYTIPTLNNPGMNPFENIVVKEENAGNQYFSFSHNVFYPSKKVFLFEVTYVLSSANAFNLDQFKIFLFGKEYSKYSAFKF